jgi:hypothetical protein
MRIVRARYVLRRFRVSPLTSCILSLFRFRQQQGLRNVSAPHRLHYIKHQPPRDCSMLFILKTTVVTQKIVLNN